MLNEEELVKTPEEGKAEPAESAGAEGQSPVFEEKAPDEEAMSMADLDESDLEDQGEVTPGALVSGEVIQVSNDFVFLDVGSKMDGKIPRAEVPGEVKTGSKLEAAVIRVNRDTGDLVLSMDRACSIKAKQKVYEAMNGEGYIEGIVLEKKDDMYIVDIGMPVRVREKEFHNRVDNIKQVIGKNLKFKIVKFIDKKDIIHLSRKAYLWEVQNVQRKELLKNLEVGKKIKGTVRNIVSYGVFVDIGGIDGFIHISDLSWSRNPRIRDIVSEGDEVEVIVLNIEEKNKTQAPEKTAENEMSEKGQKPAGRKPVRKQKDIRISLGLKQLKDNPWTTITDKYQVGMQVKGQVEKIFESGAIIALEEGIDAFARKEDISWARYLKSPKKLLKPGEMVEARIQNIDLQTKRIALSLKEVLPNPWNDVGKKYYVGEKVKGKVVKIIPKGVFVELDDFFDGFISIENLSWTKKIKNPRDKFRPDQDVEAVILDISAKDQRISLGVKQFEANPWDIFNNQHPPKTIVKGKIVNITHFGLFLDIGSGLEGLVHVKDIDKEKAEDLSKHFRVGEEYSVVVLSVKPGEKRIALSLKDYDRVIQEKEIEQYMKDTGETTEKLGNMIQLKPAKTEE